MAALEPRQMVFTAGEGGPVIARLWMMPEKHLCEFLRRAHAGEDPEMLMFELMLIEEAE